MTNVSVPSPLASPPSRWRMPIHPETYRDRHPRLTEEEKTLMEQYATAPATFMTGGRARNVLHRLARFETPFLEVVGLSAHMDTTLTAGRRYLFTWMVQKGLAFWSWPKEVWVEVIQAAPGAKHASGTRFWMLLLAYLFGDVLYIGTATVYWPMAATIFGQALAETEVNKVRAQLLAAGYAGDQRKEGRLRWITALCMLVNRNPLVETFSAQLFVTVDELLADIEGAGHIQGRWAQLRLQTALC